MSCADSDEQRKQNTERYRSGHNEAVLKTVCPQGHMGSNPILSILLAFLFLHESISPLKLLCVVPVSYTHLDVYKRQPTFLSLLIPAFSLLIPPLLLTGTASSVLRMLLYHSLRSCLLYPSMRHSCEGLPTETASGVTRISRRIR